MRLAPSPKRDQVSVMLVVVAGTPQRAVVARVHRAVPGSTTKILVRHPAPLAFRADTVKRKVLRARYAEWGHTPIAAQKAVPSAK